MPVQEAGGAISFVSALSDDEALRRIREGDDASRSGFRVLYDRYFLDVYRFEKRLLGDHDSAEDATQEAFARLLRSAKTIDPARGVRPFLFSLARNVAIDVLRARQKKPLSLDGDAPASAPESEPERRERLEAVEEALGALAPEHRSLLLLRHVQGLKLDEIAEGSDCTVRTVRNRLRAAGALFGRELKRRGIVSKEVQA